MDLIIDIALACAFLYSSNPSRYPHPSLGAKHSDPIGVFSYSNLFSRLHKSFQNFVNPHDQIDYALFSVIYDKYSVIKEIGIAGLWMDMSYGVLKSMVAGLGLCIITMSLIIHLFHKKYIYHHITNYILCIVGYICFVGKTHKLLSSSSCRYDQCMININWQSIIKGDLGDLEELWNREQIHPEILLAALIGIPPIVLTYLPRFVYVNHSKECLVCTTSSIIGCLIGFITNYSVESMNDWFMWFGFKIEFSQLSIGLVIMSLLLGHAPTLIGYFTGLLISLSTKL